MLVTQIQYQDARNITLSCSNTGITVSDFNYRLDYCILCESLKTVCQVLKTVSYTHLTLPTKRIV